MKSPLVIVLVAVVLAAVSTLAVMNTACKSSQHAWCAPMSMRHHRKNTVTLRYVPHRHSNVCIDFDQITAAAAWARVVLSGALDFSPYASSFGGFLFIYDYGADRRRGGAERPLQYLNVRKRASLSSPSARHRSDSYGGDTTSLTARRERSIARKRCLHSRCRKSGHQKNQALQA